MILLYLLLALSGIVVTTMLAVRRSGHAVTAGIGTLVAFLSILSGFSIGIYLAPVALLLLLLAARHLKD
jgi:hypothetical protein